MKASQYKQAFLLVFGGPPGSGKTHLSHRLATHLRVPRLGADTIGRTIKASPALVQRTINTQWLAYDILFQLCGTFLHTGVSVILDLNLAWDFQWQQVGDLNHRHPNVQVLTMILQCQRSLCLERIQQRYEGDPAYYDPPEHFMTDPGILARWAFLEQLARTDAYFVDASRSADAVYNDVIHYLVEQLNLPIDQVW